MQVPREHVRSTVLQAARPFDGDFSELPRRSRRLGALGAYDLLDYAAYFSTELGDAIDRVARFHPVLSDLGALERGVARGVRSSSATGARSWGDCRGARR